MNQAIKIINLLNTMWLSDYYIAKILWVQRVYLKRWHSGLSPCALYYNCLIKLLEISKSELLSLKESENVKTYKKRILNRYKEFITTPLYVVWKKQYSIRRSSH